MRKCCNCGLTKPLTEYSINRANASGTDYFCKTCKALKKQTYYHSKEGVIQTILDSQKASCKKRGHIPPEYSKEELTQWIYSQETFEQLYSNWVKSNYDKYLKPSIDRLDDFKTYSIDNIRLVTFQENVAKAYSDKHLGTGTQGLCCKPVLQYTKEGILVAEYSSATIASQNVPNTNRQNIQKVCKGERPTCGNYIWKYKS